MSFAHVSCCCCCCCCHCCCCCQVADYESLIRRVMRRAPNAALMSFAHVSCCCCCCCCCCCQVADYESLIRRVMRKAPNAALMSFAIFGFYSQSGVQQNGKEVLLPTPWYNTGRLQCEPATAGFMHNTIAEGLLPVLTTHSDCESQLYLLHKS
jgi:hypothetical protein